MCDSFDFMNEDECLPDLEAVPPEPVPLSPRTVAYREQVVRESLDLGKLEFV